jgi:hypothetical protein
VSAAVYPAQDADHVAQWDLDEQESDLLPLDPLLGTLDGAHVPPQWSLHMPFVDAVAGNNLALYDTNPEAAASRFFEIGAPGPFGGSVVFKGGSGTNERDYLYGASTIEPTGGLTIDMWIKPYTLTGAANLIQKEFSPSAWAAPFVSAQLYQAVNSGEWGVSVAIGGSRYAIDAIGHGNSVQHLRLVYGVWNHIGLTLDGEWLRAYVNGLLADTVSAEGPVDWGTHGAWVLGGSRAIGAAALDAANGAIGRTRISKVARPLSYFFNSYQGAVVGVAGVVGGAGAVLAPPVIPIVGRGPGGIGLGLD